MLEWLHAAQDRLGFCATAVNLTAPNQLTFVRRSTVPFTALELHLLGDWLESPEFPRGLHSLLVPGQAVPAPWIPPPDK
jgi:hypothetical protein